MTKFVSKFDLCLAGAKGSGVTSNNCSAAGTSWILEFIPKTVQIKSENGLCLAVATTDQHLVTLSSCGQDNTKWILDGSPPLITRLMSKFQSQNSCLVATSDIGSKITTDKCENPGAIWQMKNGHLAEEIAEIVGANSTLIGEDA